jgi:uncharacterized protein (TIGR00369 family)
MQVDERLAQAIRTLIVDSPYGTLLGVRLAELERDRVRLTLPFRHEVTTIGALVHGGAIASLIDVAAAAAVWSNADPEAPRRGVTVGFSVNFLAAADGKDLTADAAVLRRGRELVVCDVAVRDMGGRDGGGRDVARALVTYKLG